MLEEDGGKMTMVKVWTQGAKVGAKVDKMVNVKLVDCFSVRTAAPNTLPLGRGKRAWRLPGNFYLGVLRKVRSPLCVCVSSERGGQPG